MTFRKLLGCSLLVVLASAVQNARGASFDCAKAVRPVEKVICGNAKLSAADGAMATAYRADLPRLTSAGIGLLRADQVQWLAWAQLVCKVGEPKQIDIAACLLPLYTDRTKQLRTAIAVRDGLTFLKRTQYLAQPEKPDDTAGAPEYEGFGTMKVSWPRADTGDASWLAWSAAVEGLMLRRAGAGQDQDTEAGKRKLPFVWVDAMAASADVTLDADLKSVEHGRVTTIVMSNGMGHGAAHPFETSETMTWLLNDKRALRVSDVFAGNTWKHRVSVLCWDLLKDDREHMYDDVKGPDDERLQEVIADTGNWTLEKDGLHISYPDYTVAPRISQLDDSTLTWAELKGVLAPGFVAP